MTEMTLLLALVALWVVERLFRPALRHRAVWARLTWHGFEFFAHRDGDGRPAE